MSFNHKEANSPPPKKKINLSKCQPKPELSKPVYMTPPPKPTPPENVTIIDNPISPLLTGIFIGLLIGLLILIGCGVCGVFKTAS